MPISIEELSEIAAETRSVAVKLGEHTVNVTYKPAWYTLAVEERLAALPPGAQEVASTFCEMVSAWDVTNGSGKPIPVTPEALKQHNIPIKVLRTILRAVAEDQEPPKRG